MKPFVCITHLVSWIMEESKKIIQDTNHEEEWCFYHDALSLMTAAATLACTEETTVDSVTIKKRWLVPQKGVNKGTIYEDRPVGNLP